MFNDAKFEFEKAERVAKQEAERVAKVEAIEAPNLEALEAPKLEAIEAAKLEAIEEANPEAERVAKLEAIEAAKLAKKAAKKAKKAAEKAVKKAYFAKNLETVFDECPKYKPYKNIMCDADASEIQSKCYYDKYGDPCLNSNVVCSRRKECECKARGKFRCHKTKMKAPPP
eukprot:scaffold55327_cov48-Attheya_sp.AAC.2